MKKKYHLYLTIDQRRLIPGSLIVMKNKLIRTGHYTDAIDEILIQLTKAKTTRVRVMMLC